MLREALDFPTAGAHGSRSLLAGSGLLLVAGLLAGGASYAFDTGRTAAAGVLAALVLLPVLLVRGYYYRALKAATSETDPVAPSFSGLGRLLRQAVAALLVSAFYAIPAGALFAVAAGARVLPASLSPDATVVGESVGALAALLGIAALVGALFLVPAATAAMAREGSLRAGLRVRSVAGAAASEDYAVGWVLAVFLQWTLAPIAIALSALGLGVVLYFLTGVATRYVWGASYAASVGVESSGIDSVGITPPSRGLDLGSGDGSAAPVGRSERDSDTERLVDEGR